ncbi:MAG: anthranilate synthase component I [Chloroflexota bacterium]
MASNYFPDLDAFSQYVKDGATIVPVYREFSADLETPVTVYLKLMSENETSFLLESVAPGGISSRYSFLGVNPRGVIKLNGRTITDSRLEKPYDLPEGEDILHVLEREMEGMVPTNIPGLPLLQGGAVGFLGYDTVRFYEELPTTAERAIDIPEAIFMLADTLIVFDHIRHRIQVLSNVRIVGDRTPQGLAKKYVAAIGEIEKVAEKLLRPLPSIPTKRWGVKLNGSKGKITSNKTAEEYMQMVRDAKEYIAAGDIFQVVLSQRFERRTDAHPFMVYRALRMLNPSPYMFYLNFGDEDFQVVGASPEVHVTLEDDTAELRPIAGTRRRGKDEAEDLELEKDMLDDPKEVAEHVMLVDLGRNDLGRVCEYGSVKVTDMMVVERYSHVMHIVSHVKGKIDPNMDAFELMRATFPAGTLSGAPKVRAMEIIEELEGQRRHLYGGIVGYFSYDGNSDTCIAIRTMVMKGDKVYIQAGAGLVADSDPASEHEECINKAMAVVKAIDLAEEGGF